MKNKYELGVVFSGGGAKAAAHCGAVQAMIEYGIEPQVLAGTSAGSLVATFYSAGIKPKEMIEIFQGLNFFKDIVKVSTPGAGLFDSQPLLQILREILPYKTFEQLPVPVYAIASDMDNAKVKVFSKGEIAPRLVASCSIPIVFKPIVINGVHYIDGGVFQNLPVPAIRNMCDKVIAFSVRHLDKEPFKNNLLHSATRAYNMMFMSNIMADARLANIFIELDTDGCSVYDIDKGPELFFRGYDCACRAFEAEGFKRIMPPEEIRFSEPESRIGEEIKELIERTHERLSRHRR